MHQDTGSFVEFPERDGILHRLRSMEVYQTSMEGVFHLAADRLANRAYDRSAFVFILLELIYELPEDTISFGDLLGRMVFALSQDLDLVGEALEAFEEIRETLQPEPADDPIDLPPDDDSASSETASSEAESSPKSSPATAALVADDGSTNGRSATVAASDGASSSREAGSEKTAELERAERHERLMTALQSTQKEVLDAGLATRASIEQTLARPTRSNVRQTLGEIETLRTDLLRFEDLLRQSERQILEAIGVLD